MRSAHAAVDGSCSPSRPHHDALDTTSQVTPVAPLACFITTESALYRPQDPREQDDSNANVRPQLRKQHECSMAQESAACGSGSGVRQPRSTAPSASRRTKHEVSPSSKPLVTALSSPDSIGSIPSSPGDLSSFTMSEGPPSVSASFSELPRSQSPGLSHTLTSATASAPQLVMPSLTVPRRRSFSETGRSLGKLKILVTGHAGIGKGSLILAIAQSCTHIVHMDSIDSPSKSTMRTTYASTRPKPWWRTHHGQGLAPHRRRASLPDEVLDRNICFVDCDAHSDGNGASFPAVQYVETQLAHLLHSPVDDISLTALLSGGTEPNVDVALYLLPFTGPSALDIQCMKNLQVKTNVIPLLALADTLPIDRLASAKSDISQKLKVEDVDCFAFSMPDADLDHPFVYAVSSATRPDYDTLDASILMASDYQPPLFCTDLDSLITDVMSVDGSAWLRHSAASKAVNWLRQRGHGNSFASNALTYMQPYSRPSPPKMRLMDIHSNKRYWDRMDVCDWAEALRQSLCVERFDLLQRPPPVRMLDEHCSLVRTDCGRPRLRRHRRPAGVFISSNQDPLGLLELASRVQFGGKLTLEMLSTFVIISINKPKSRQGVPRESGERADKSGKDRQIDDSSKHHI
ncbi:hypothetical protein E4U42_003826 [Claviceps africana]|uniref:Septin-type G domain-containing protein n=1 Tax=Claviceps africana TaxID=83212 RepID=A0A8K0NL97_9HYPO|nr:hypothetical protein E4U42_003826 [Claviceps africana]